MVIDVRRKRLVKRASVAKDVGDMHFTVLGKKKPFFGGEYTVLVSRTKEKTRMIKGGFEHVVLSMKSSEKAENGIPVVHEVAEALSDPKRSLRNEYNDAELLIIGVLANGPMSPADIADVIRQKREPTSLILRGLETMGIVCSCRRRGDPPGGYSLTREGKKKAKLLAVERDYKLDHIAKLKLEEEER